MRTPNYKSWVIGLFAVTFLASVAGAQDQSPSNPNQPEAPIPAYHSPLAGAADNGQSDENSPDITPDTHSLSGAQTLTLGSPFARTYWQPSFSFSGAADSNPVVTHGGGDSWTGWMSLSGSIDVHRVSGNNTLDLNYVTGGMIPAGGAGGSGIVQELSATDAIAFRRWNLSLIEQVSYLPPSGFGLGGLGTTGVGGIGTPPLDPGLGTGQTLLAALGQSLSSSSDVEVDAKLTNRTSLTFVGGYSLLRFLDTSTLDYGSVNARAGYNYQWTRKDTLSVSYTYSAYHYSNFNQSINSQAVQVSYGRRLTGRMALQASAGPQFASFTMPIPTGSTSPASSETQLYWTANASLSYQLRRTSLTGSYFHGVSGGSGVLAGAITDTASGSLSRQITRTLSGSITGGYSRNHGVALITVPPTTTAQTYDYWSGGGSLSRSWGRSLSLNLSYQMQYQTSGVGFCVGVTCGTSYFRNIISVGVGWHEHPLLF
jgi:hypothetical protein